MPPLTMKNPGGGFPHPPNRKPWHNLNVSDINSWVCESWQTMESYGKFYCTHDITFFQKLNFCVNSKNGKNMSFRTMV